MNKDKTINGISTNHPLFDSIEKDDVMELLYDLGAYVRKYKKSNFIFYEEDDVKSIGIVLKGHVAMIKEDMWATKTIVTIINKEDILGETFACSNNMYISTVSFEALCNVEVLFIPFSKVINSNDKSNKFYPILVQNMLKLIAEKNMQMINKINIMSQKTLREKISAYLSDQILKNNDMKFSINLGRVQLAEYLGVDRSALTRELNKMRDEGLIEFHKNTFHVCRKLYK